MTVSNAFEKFTRIKLSFWVKYFVVGAVWLGSLSAVHAQESNPDAAITVRADVQEANSETGVITARGNVYINYPARDIQATAAQAQYFSRERRLVLSGNVYVLQQGNSMRAEKMTYLVDEGRFIATPESEGQVESIYLIPETTNSTTTPPTLPQ